MRKAGDNLRIREEGLTITYDDYGPIYAPVVIFIHAFPFNRHMWDMQTEALKSNYRVISYDIRGFGDSVPSDADHSVSTLCEDLMHLMDLLQIKKAAVCGLSYGGTIALAAIEKYPERFNALILSDTDCDPVESGSAPLSKAGLRLLKEKGIRAFADKSIRRFFSSVSFLRRKEEVRAARKMILSTPVSSLCDTLREMSENKWGCGHPEKIGVPVLIVVGKEDSIIPPEKARRLQAMIPGAALKVIEFSGHLPNLENTFEFNRLLKLFMDKVSRRRLIPEISSDHR